MITTKEIKEYFFEYESAAKEEAELYSAAYETENPDSNAEEKADAAFHKKLQIYMLLVNGITEITNGAITEDQAKRMIATHRDEMRSLLKGNNRRPYQKRDPMKPIGENGDLQEMRESGGETLTGYLRTWEEMDSGAQFSNEPVIFRCVTEDLDDGKDYAIFTQRDKTYWVKV